MRNDTEVVERTPARHAGCGLADIPPREGPSTAWRLSAVAVGVLGLIAVGALLSAITVVARLPFGDTGVVLPTVPLTTTVAPPPPPNTPVPAPPPVTHASPPATHAPANPPEIAPAPSPPPPPAPKPSATHSSPPSTSHGPSSVHPTTHRPFPQETTDFPGPPGTNA